MFKAMRVSLNMSLKIIIVMVIIAEKSIMIAPIACGPLCGFVNRCPYGRLEGPAG
jgi:hypothetical protein